MANSPFYDYDRVGRLLLQALGTGSHGLLAAHRVLQLCPGPFPWNSILENLCMNVPCQDGLTGKLILKPKLFQLPIQLQRNFFSLLNFIFYYLPTPCIQLVAKMVRKEKNISDEWLLYHTHQFLQNSDHETCIHRTQVMGKLQILCQGLGQSGAELPKLGRYHQIWCSSPADCSMMQHKSDTPLEDQRGQILNICREELCTNSQSHKPDDVGKLEEEAAPTDTEEDSSIAWIASTQGKAHISNLKQIVYLEIDTETMDHEYLLKLKNICDACTPLQLQTLFSSVGVTQISPKCLFQLCTYLDYISPDLSYAHAESLASIFFLEQVLSLSAPASRTLTAALTMFCRKYAGPACNTLISPLLAKAETGSAYADFLCRMISECLESHELHLCFDSIFKIPCSEVSVSVLHMLVDKKETLNQSEFDLLLNHICHAAENLSKSKPFSKFLLVLLTSKKNLVEPYHIGLLTNSLNFNQTFLKKSLQNALRKVQESFK
ncbi:Fanconi anemia group E protein [Phyllobates terribilis]|uniref:Fanconi anemia group E protein n=1 Tax=Phyllobates terribilis TaxID=111132 RepID=UPI003CCB18E4